MMSTVVPVYWMDTIEQGGKEKVSDLITSFARQDIDPDKKCRVDQITDMIKNTYGKGSCKARDINFVTSVIEEHEKKL